MTTDEKPKHYEPDEGGLASDKSIHGANAWNPKRETLEQWRDRRSAHWRANNARNARWLLTGDC